VIVAGEPGGSLPAVRQRIEQAWQADVIDHAGATEVGPWGYSNHARTGLHVIESEFIAEFVDVQTLKPVSQGQLAELVLTSLGRYGSPVIRYRTGDLVRPRYDTESDNQFVFLDGGVLGRVDEMMIVRGVNVYPSAIEQVVREFPGVNEFRITVTKQGEMDALLVDVEVEGDDQSPKKIAERLQSQLGLHVSVRAVPIGILPRGEHKRQRFIDLRKR
jgi:phenylacetate-CoA ligase